MTFTPVIPAPALFVVFLVLAGWAIAGIARATSRSERQAWVGRILMVVLLLLVAVRPALPSTGSGSSASGGLEIYFAVDTTSSMAAEDYAGKQQRLIGAKTDIAAIATALPGAQYSLVTFDATAVQRVPLTKDVSALASAVSVMTQEVTVYSRGTSIDEPVDVLVDILTHARDANPGNDRVVFYLGDGEHTSSTPPGNFDPIAALVSGGAVLGYGTSEGGRMLEFDGFADEHSTVDYIKDYSKNPPVDAVSKIDEAALRDIADELGVRYANRAQYSPIDDVVAGIDVGDIRVENLPERGPVEVYWIFAIALGALVLAELARLSGAMRDLKQHKSEQS
jgi:Ca-activated chloride channel family protein